MLIYSMPLSKLYEVNIVYINPITEEKKEVSRKIRGSNASDAMAFCLKEVAEEISENSRNKNNQKIDYAELTADAKPCEEIKENNLENLTKEEVELVLA